MTAVQMPSTIPLPQKPSVMGDYMHLPSGDINGRNMHYIIRHESSLRRYDHHQEQSHPQEQREKDALHQRHLENKSKKKFNNNKQNPSETIGVSQVKVKSEMACGAADPNRNNTTKTNERKRAFDESSGPDVFGQDSETNSQTSYAKTTTTHASDEHPSKKQRTEISLKIVSNSDNHVKVTTTIESGSDAKSVRDEKNISGQSFVSNVVDIRQESREPESDKDQLQNGDYSSSDLGNFLENVDKRELIKLIEQGDIDNLVKEYGGNVQDIEQMLTEIIAESQEELQECSAPNSNLSNQEKVGETKEEGTKKGVEEQANTLKTEQKPASLDSRSEPPPNMNVSDAFPIQPLPSIRELKKPASSGSMPSVSILNQPMKIEENNHTVPSRMYPHSNNATSMPRVPAIPPAMSGLVPASSVRPRTNHVLRNAVPPPNNTVHSTINQASSNIYPNSHFSSTPQSPQMPHMNTLNNPFSNPQSSTTNLAQILKGPQARNSCLPSLSNAFQQCSGNNIPGRSNNVPVHNGSFLPNTKTVGGYVTAANGTRIPTEHYKKILLHKQRLHQQQQQQLQQQQQQQQQQQALGQHMRGPPPPYAKIQQPNATMSYPSMPARTVTGGMNRSLPTGMQGMPGGLHQGNMSTPVHLGTQQAMQQPQQQPMGTQLNVQHARLGNTSRIANMRQVIAQNRLQNLTMQRQRIGIRAPGMAGQDQMMPQQQQQQQQQQMPMHTMRRNAVTMLPGNRVGNVQQLTSTHGSHPHMNANDMWQGSMNTNLPSVNNLTMQPQGIGQQPQGMGQQRNSNMSQFAAPNGSMQTVVNVQTSQNTSQNINIQASVQTHTVLHQPQTQPAFNTALNNQRLLQQQRLQQQQQSGLVRPGMTINQVPPMGIAAGQGMTNQGMIGSVQQQIGTNLHSSTPLQSSSQMDLDLLDNIIRKDT